MEQDGLQLEINQHPEIQSLGLMMEKIGIKLVILFFQKVEEE